jgi:BlaI family transcriptional regulator, penicillinase repressor
MIRPTDIQLAILRVLWERGPSTVREVHQALAADRDTGYTTTLKLMQVMAARGLVTRNDDQRSHVYAPRWSREHMRRHLVTDLISRAFGGSTSALVLEALNGQTVSKSELAEIRELIDKSSRQRRRP